MVGSSGTYIEKQFLPNPPFNILFDVDIYPPIFVFGEYSSNIHL